MTESVGDTADKSRRAIARRWRRRITSTAVKDNRWCAVAVFTEEEWRGLKRALGNPAWAEDERFATLAGRLENREELDRLIAAWTREHTAEEVMSRLQKNGVAAGIVQDAADLAKDPQLKARGFFIEDAECLSPMPRQSGWGSRGRSIGGRRRRRGRITTMYTASCWV